MNSLQGMPGSSQLYAFNERYAPTLTRLKNWVLERYFQRCPFQKEEVMQIVSLATNALENAARAPSTLDASKSEEAKQIKIFLSFVKPYYKSDETIQKCIREHAAFRLGVSSRVFDPEINPGFADYVLGNYIYDYMKVYDHSLKVDEGHRVSILYQGAYRPWAEVSHIATQPVPGSVTTQKYPKMYNIGWRYGQNGLQNEHFYAKPHLLPYLTRDNVPDKEKNTFTLCVLSSPHLRIFGNHTWVEITTEKDTYAVGIYRSDNNIPTGCEMKSGDLQNPDCSVFWSEDAHRISFNRTPEQIQQAIQKLESDLNASFLRFHLVGESCTKYALSVAQVAGISLSASTSALYEFTPQTVTNMLMSIYHPSPAPLQSVERWFGMVLAYPPSLMLQCLQLYLGTRHQDRSFTEEQKQQAPAHFQSWWDFFNLSKLEMESPNFLAQRVIPALLQRRKGEANKQGIPVDQLDTWLPPEHDIS